MALVTVQRSPTPSTTSSPCASRWRLAWGLAAQAGLELLASRDPPVSAS
uniref:Slingshot protein phosphatase 2 n=3 Tax=Cercopithecidae TaxID=9527 RepID=A0A2K5LU51_CERAT